MEDDACFLVVLRYIHQNPVKARLVKSVEQYKWSSFNKFVSKDNVIGRDFTLKMFNEDQENALKSFIQYSKEVSDDVCLDLEEKQKITDIKARDIIKKVCKLPVITDVQKLDIHKRLAYLRKLKEEHDLSVR